MANIPWKTKQEIDEEKLLDSLKPTKDDVEQAEFKLKSITLLMEVGLL